MIEALMQILFIIVPDSFAAQNLPYCSGYNFKYAKPGYECYHQDLGAKKRFRVLYNEGASDGLPVQLKIFEDLDTHLIWSVELETPSMNKSFGTTNQFFTFDQNNLKAEFNKDLKAAPVYLPYVSEVDNNGKTISTKCNSEIGFNAFLGVLTVAQAQHARLPTLDEISAVAHHLKWMTDSGFALVGAWTSSTDAEGNPLSYPKQPWTPKRSDLKSVYCVYRNHP